MVRERERRSDREVLPNRKEEDVREEKETEKNWGEVIAVYRGGISAEKDEGG